MGNRTKKEKYRPYLIARYTLSGEEFLLVCEEAGVHWRIRKEEENDETPESRYRSELRVYRYIRRTR
jgi:hypothetical protein